jgi:LmbE family N-acetylglucosaminyl deacetylase
MNRLSRQERASFLLLLCVVLGLLVFVPSGSLFAELDEAQAATMMDNLRRGVLLSVSWIFLAVGLLLVILTLRKTYFWLKAVQKTRVPPTRYFNLQLQVRSREGDLGLHNYDYYPVVVAAAGAADLLLPDVADSKARFRIDYRQGQAHLFSDSSVIVNGVPRRQKQLRQDDRIIFGPYRLVFKDASIQEQSAPVPARPIFAWQFPIVALLLALSVLFRQAGTVPEDTMLLAKAAELQSIERGDRLQAGSEPAGERHESTRRSGRSEPFEPAAVGTIAPEPVPLVQRLRRLFARFEPDEPRLAEGEHRAPMRAGGTGEGVVGSPPPVQESPEAAARKSAAAQSPLRSQSTPESPGEQKPAETVIAEMADPAARSAAVASRRSSPPASAVAGRDTVVDRDTVVERDTAVHRDAAVDRAAVVSSPSPPAAAASQPLPEARPVMSSEPPVEAVAQVPAPRSVDSVPLTAQPLEVVQRSAAQKPPVLQASVLGTIASAAIQNDRINPLEGLSFARARSAPEIGRTKVRVIPPGRPVEYFKADILFIHAHPDDESIDFGSLMAMASRSSKRIVTLLFTDGESGLDLYPQRMVGDIYPARDLSGPALSQVRVVEATRALSILGSEMYVRWGLENRPYNCKADEVPPEEVIRGWGGEERLVAGLIEILEGFRPTIVVSPDCHSRAYEHFEHEAVGQLVQTALERLQRRGESSVKGYLVSIDPYQVDRYSGVTAVDALMRDEESGLTYRAIQARALREHVTQRDASVIAVSRLSPLPQEFYKALYWNLGGTVEEYLK